MKDDPISVCPTCTGSVKRLLYPVGIVFKGSGWYINDSRKPDKSESGPAPASESKDDKSAEAKSESKSDAAAEPKSEASSESKPATAAT